MAVLLKKKAILMVESDDFREISGVFTRRWDE